MHDARDAAHQMTAIPSRLFKRHVRKETPMHLWGVGDGIRLRAGTLGAYARCGLQTPRPPLDSSRATLRAWRQWRNMSHETLCSAFGWHLTCRPSQGVCDTFSVP